MQKMTLLTLLCGLTLAVGQAQAGNAEAGKTKANDACADCHGADGKGDADSPATAGLTEEVFIKAMKEYQAETRTKSKKMIKAAKKVSDEEIADLAAYYATLKK
jgi:cytochrome c553